MNLVVFGRGEAWHWFTREFAGYHRPLAALVSKTNYLVWELDASGYLKPHFRDHLGLLGLVGLSGLISWGGLLCRFGRMFERGHAMQ